MANGLALLGILNVMCGRVEPASCTCIPAPALPGDGELLEAISDGAVFFTGRVIRAEPRPASRSQESDGAGRSLRMPELVITIAVTEAWSRSVTDTATVVTPLYSTACGASLTPGESYLIDARFVTGGLLSTTKCSRTRPYGEAEPLIARLRQLQR